MFQSTASRPILALLLFTNMFYPAQSSLRVLRSPDFEGIPPPTVQEADCNDCEKDIPVIRGEGLVATAQLDSCKCSVVGDSCSCSGACPPAEEDKVCEELLGQCSCMRFDAGYCECQGHCRTREDRVNACEDEEGCMWMGHWCQAEAGMIFN
eukprot:gb/GFBE01013318.1/.p1 GENE.gb/GFBE01013318.1/~~gb/GFBE01013318.1/.p1  ORF type:complete len:152 (+),score=40.62 gb/GFBE01013318.1/:1-456(+)